jgi:hypothetical protein
VLGALATRMAGMEGLQTAMAFRGRTRLYSYYHTYLPSHDMGLYLGTLFSQSENTKFLPPRLLLPPLLTFLTETPIANHPHYRFWNRSRDLDVEVCRCESSPKSMESEDNKSVA